MVTPSKLEIKETEVEMKRFSSKRGLAIAWFATAGDAVILWRQLERNITSVSKKKESG
jgi:hypothetical protein